MISKMWKRQTQILSELSPSLEILKPSECARRISLDGDDQVIGRDETCDLWFDLPDVSRRHVRIFCQEEVWNAEDLGSRNGVFLNGDRIGRSALADGDVLTIGSIVIKFHQNGKTRLTFDQNVKKLLEVSISINSSLVPEEVLQRIIDSVAQISRAERACLMLLDCEGNLEPKVTHNLEVTSMGSAQFVISRSIAKQTAESRRPVILDRIPDGEGSASMIALGLKAVACLPILHKDQVIGVVYADSRSRSWIRQLDIHILESLASYAAVSLENARLNQELKDAFFNTSMALAEAIDARDPYTAGHSRRVTEDSRMIGRGLGLSREQLDWLQIASTLHDVGKIGIDDRILRKPAPLNSFEYAEIKKHPEIGAKILGHVPQLAKVIPAVRGHHERVDGRGYPDGLAGDQIPLLARIIAVADVFDAMTSERVYRGKLSTHQALQELQEGMGTQFDAHIVEVFLAEFEANRGPEGHADTPINDPQDRQRESPGNEGTTPVFPLTLTTIP